MHHRLLMICCGCLLQLWCASPGLCQEQNSANDQRLRRLFEQWPQADLNGDGILTQTEARTAWKKLRNWQRRILPGARPAPTLADIRYGPHERNTLDLYLADSEHPTPLVVFIHGGGFTDGDKRLVDKDVLKTCLNNQVSVAALDYRFLDEAPLQDILRDCARGIQFLRKKAREYNLDKTRVACYGGSAGGGTSLWLAVHDDLADPDSVDAVLRESSRPMAVGVYFGQFSYDFTKWAAVIGDSPRAADRAGAYYHIYHFSNREELHSPAARLILDDLDMLSMLDGSDCPIFLYNNRKGGEPVDYDHYLHHPRHSLAIKRKCDAVGLECELLWTPEEQVSRQVANRRMLRLFFEKFGISQAVEGQ